MFADRRAEKPEDYLRHCMALILKNREKFDIMKSNVKMEIEEFSI